MTNEQYQRMLDMLIVATQKRKLDWHESKEYYSVQIGDCAIHLTSDYDYDVGETFYTISLYNSDNQKFADYYISNSSVDDDQEYEKIRNLYESVKDSIYRITESEKNILDNLEELTK